MELLFKEPGLEEEFEKLNHNLRRIVGVFRGLMWAWFEAETLIIGVSRHISETEDDILDEVRISANDLTQPQAVRVSKTVYRLFSEWIGWNLDMHWDKEGADSYFTLTLPRR